MVGVDIRVLVALEDNYRAYRETIAASLQILHPVVEVESINNDALKEALERFDPQVVICSGHEDVEANSRPAWIELSLEPTQPTKIRVGRRYLELTDFGVAELLEVIHELE